MITDQCVVDTWERCYKRGWGKTLAPEAYVHPAKVSFGLAERIYKHLLAEGWLKPGDTVLDPFGGIGGFAFHALQYGLNFVGVELEPRFVALGQANIDLWNKRYGGKLPVWGSARLLQGDSRQLLAVLRSSIDGAVSSPPYNLPMSQDHNGRRGGKRGTEPSEAGAFVKYGNTPGQLEGLPMTDEGFQAAVASPPFRHQTGGVRITATDGPLADPKLFDRHAATNAAAHGYGEAPGQLANMAEGEYQAAVSSPPYEHEQVHARQPEYLQQKSVRYGLETDNLGNKSGDTFWTAARAIVAQTHAALRPGGVAVWVLKAFVRNKQLVDFPGQWRQLCESAGFVTVHEHHAMLTEDDGTQLAHDGRHKHYRRKRASFFRRLAEQKGAPPINYEVVYCMVKAPSGR